MYILEQAGNGGWVVRRGAGVLGGAVDTVMGAFTNNDDLLEFLGNELPDRADPAPIPSPKPPMAPVAPTPGLERRG